MTDARVVEILENLARGLLQREQVLARHLAKLPRLRDIAGQLEASPQQRAGGAEARGVRIVRIDGPSVRRQRRIVARSAGVIFDQVKGAADDGAQKRMIHSGVSSNVAPAGPAWVRAGS